MKEQSGYLTSIGFTATYIGQGNNKDDLVAGKYQFVFSSPESILSVTKWRDLLTSPPYKNLELFVVDEAHTVLQWWVCFELGIDKNIENIIFMQHNMTHWQHTLKITLIKLYIIYLQYYLLIDTWY